MSSRRNHRWPGLLLLILLLLIGFAPARCTRDADTGLYEQLGRLCGLGSEPTLQLRLDPSEPVEMRAEQRARHYIVSPAVGTLLLDDDTVFDTFAAIPLGPRDLAVIADNLADRGVKALAISSPLVWPKETADITRDILSNVLQRFPAATLGLRGRTAAQADFTPIVLRDYAIPTENISGDPTGLPAANRPLPNGLAETPDGISVDWAPDWLEDEPLTQHPSAVDDLSFPLVMRWNGETMPTLPLRVALRRLGLKPADIRLELGKSIRIGEREIPIDANGRIRLRHASVTPIRLTDVIGSGSDGNTGDSNTGGSGVSSEGNEESDSREAGASGSEGSEGSEGSGADAADSAAAPGADFPTAVIIERPMDGDKRSSRVDRMGLTLSELLGEIHTETEQVQVPAHTAVLDYRAFLLGRPLWLIPELVLLGLLVALLRRLPRVIRLLVMLALLGGLLAKACGALLSGQWFSLTALLLMWLLVLPVVMHRRKRRNGSFRS